jgi:hypothetical protein
VEPQSYLPSAYLAGFGGPPLPGETGPHVWAFRAWIGEWRRAPVARVPGEEFHFNDIERGALERVRALDADIAATADAALPLLGSAIEQRQSLAPDQRRALARFGALLGVRNASNAGDLDLAEARGGVDALAALLAEMGWVFWIAERPHFFIGSSSPFHAVLPAGRRGPAVGFTLREPAVEITLPLSTRVALHATWARTGELWRSAREEVVLEVNGRTCMASRRYLVSPEARLPG